MTRSWVRSPAGLLYGRCTQKYHLDDHLEEAIENGTITLDEMVTRFKDTLETYL